VTRLSDERICRGREFQLLGGEDTQKAPEAKMILRRKVGSKGTHVAGHSHRMIGHGTSTARGRCGHPAAPRPA